MPVRLKKDLSTSQKKNLFMANAPVSVVVPVRNCAELLTEALQSVEDQSWRPQEIIVVDGESTDDPHTVAARFENTVMLRNPKGSASEGRNIGAAHASQPFLAFLDADDLWPDLRIKLQLERLQQNAELDLVTGMMQRFRSDGMAEIVAQGKPLPSQLPSVALMRRAAFWRVGPFSSQWKVGETVEWCARASDIGLRRAAIPEIVLLRRLHANNLGNSVEAPMQCYLDIVRGVLQRRRAADKL
jgi:glycosyltransferase involved in cell wall biosynthesis